MKFKAKGSNVLDKAIGMFTKAQTELEKCVSLEKLAKEDVDDKVKVLVEQADIHTKNIDKANRMISKLKKFME